MKVRRVTTGHNALGKAVFASDTEVDGTALSLLPGAEFHRLWGADRPPHFPDAGVQPERTSYFPPLGGFRFMMFTVAQLSTAQRAVIDRQALTAEMEAKLPGLAAHMEPKHPGMHRMIQGGEDFRFTLESGEPFRIRGHSSRQHLDGHLAL